MRAGFRAWIPAIVAAAFVVAAVHVLRPGVGSDCGVTELGVRAGDEPVAFVYASGWPFMARTATAYVKAHPSGGPTYCGPIQFARVVDGELKSRRGAYVPMVVPRKLQAWGAAGDVAVQGALMAVLFVGLLGAVSLAVRAGTESRRAARGQCPGCGYPRDAVEGICPECGARAE